MGDLIVRPNPMEASLRLIPCSGSVQQHLLTSYLQSLVAIMVAQFRPSKGRMTDMQAVLQLIRDSHALQVDLPPHSSGCRLCPSFTFLSSSNVHRLASLQRTMARVN